MKHKRQRRRARARRRALNSPSKVRARHAGVLAAFHMGLVEWDQAKDKYYVDDQDVTEAMLALTFHAYVFGTVRLRNSGRTTDLKWLPRA